MKTGLDNFITKCLIGCNALPVSDFDQSIIVIFNNIHPLVSLLPLYSGLDLSPRAVPRHLLDFSRLCYEYRCSEHLLDAYLLAFQRVPIFSVPKMRSTTTSFDLDGRL